MSQPGGFLVGFLLAAGLLAMSICHVLSLSPHQLHSICCCISHHPTRSLDAQHVETGTSHAWLMQQQQMGSAPREVATRCRPGETDSQVADQTGTHRDHILFQFCKASRTRTASRATEQEREKIPVSCNVQRATLI